MRWYFKVLKQYVNFKGRAPRKEFWMFFIINALISGIIGLLVENFDSQILFYILNIYLLAITLPSLAVTFRRLHDINKSGIYVLISAIVPIVGLFWLFYLLAKKGDEDDNEYGVNPRLG